MRSWGEMVVVDGVFSCDVAPVNRLLGLRPGLLGWVVRGEVG